MRGSGARPKTLALGIWLASRGTLVRAALVLAASLAVAAAVAAPGLRGRQATHLGTTAAIAIAWSAGILLAFGGALGALTRDWQQGIIALARVRGVTATAYACGRIGGLVVVLAAAVGGATLVAAVGAIAVADAPLDAAREGAAALAYALAFSFTIAPLAMAALGSQSRGGGYATLIAVLVLPELAAPWTTSLLPPGWHELTSIPAALGAVQAGAVSPRTQGLPMVRALAALAAIAAVALAIVRSRIPRVDPGDGA